MLEQRDSPDDLYKFAKAQVKQLLKKKRVGWKRDRVEEAIQDLFLAGWEVWQDKHDVGLAKNRIVSRVNNLLRDDASERKHEPRTGMLPAADAVPESGHLWDEERVRGWEQLDARANLRSDPAERAAVRDRLEQMTERQRRITELRMAEYSTEEIANQLGLSLRTVERELSNLRKELANDEGD